MKSESRRVRDSGAGRDCETGPWDGAAGVRNQVIFEESQLIQDLRTLCNFIRNSILWHRWVMCQAYLGRKCRLALAIAMYLGLEAYSWYR